MGGLSGHYSRIYAGEEPTVFYKKVGEEYYIHRDRLENVWVISNEHWNWFMGSTTGGLAKIAHFALCFLQTFGVMKNVRLLQKFSIFDL